MPKKRASYPVEVKALPGEAGQVEALVSIFGNVDTQGDRVMPGAFTKSIADWKASGDPVPVVFSHEWGDLFSHIGLVNTLEETSKGLRAAYTLDIHDNPAAAQAFKLLKRRTLKEHSFAYDVVQEHRAKDGANELTELKIIELGPTLKGANEDTELIAVKSFLDTAAKQLAVDDADEDPIDLAEAIDAALDAADTALAAGDIEQVQALLTAAETTVDALLVLLGAPDADDTKGRKAGRRLSTATQAEMQNVHDGIGAMHADMTTKMTALQDQMKALMGVAEDAPKSADAPSREATNLDQEDEQADDREPPAKSIDEHILLFNTRIEEMRATTRSTS